MVSRSFTTIVAFCAWCMCTRLTYARAGELEPEAVRLAGIQSLDIADDVDKRGQGMIMFGKRRNKVFQFGKRPDRIFSFGKRPDRVFSFGKREGENDGVDGGNDGWYAADYSSQKRVIPYPTDLRHINLNGNGRQHRKVFFGKRAEDEYADNDALADVPERRAAKTFFFGKRSDQLQQPEEKRGRVVYFGKRPFGSSVHRWEQKPFGDDEQGGEENGKFVHSEK